MNHKDEIEAASLALFAVIESALHELNAAERMLFRTHIRTAKMATNYLRILGAVADRNAKD